MKIEALPANGGGSEPIKATPIPQWLTDANNNIYLHDMGTFVMMIGRIKISDTTISTGSFVELFSIPAGYQPKNTMQYFSIVSWGDTYGDALIDSSTNKVSVRFQGTAPTNWIPFIPIIWKKK